MMRSSFDPFGSDTTLIDKMIGNAYKIVEFVATNMVHVRRASFYMKNIYDASQRLTKLIELTGPTAGGLSVDVALPAVQIEGEEGTVTTRQILWTDVVGWSSLLVQTDQTVISEASGLFSVKLLNTGSIRVSLPNGANSATFNANVKIHLSYKI